MKNNKHFTNIVSSVTRECVVFINMSKMPRTTEVGQSWVPEVAQYLIDVCPNGLEEGATLSDLYAIVEPLRFEELDV